ncbi:MAG TPA: hypothetical protein VK928_12715 [Longimicrobiales bacterium]|nr:hypothetical protein [Longimicrobiales bacterium]
MTRFITFLAFVALAPALSAQPVTTLGRPDAAIREPFSQVRAVHELASGHVLVTDWLEQRVVRADFRTGGREDRGRAGAGPREYRLPGGLLPFRGDSTLLVDVGNARLAVLDGDGVIRRFLRPPHTAAASPFGADRQGRVYFTIPPWLATGVPLPGDSVELAVWDPATDVVRVLARVHGWTPSPQRDIALGPRIPYVVFARQDAWTVSDAGAVALVRGDGYVVEWLNAAVRGPRHAGEPVRVTAADRRQAARTFAATTPVGGRGGDGASGLSAAPPEASQPEAIAQLERASTFADHLPPFRPGSATVDPRGRLWVARSEPVGRPLHYDVFDTRGVRVAIVQIPTGRRLMAAGRAHLYMVRTDNDDLQHLERYAMPALPGG